MAYALVNISKGVAPSIDITTGATTIDFASAPTGWASSGDYPITITDGTQFEIALVTGGQGTATLTVTRASEAISGDQTAHAFAAANTLITPGNTVAAITSRAASTVTGPDAFGASAVVGTDTTFAREDHNHGLPSATAPATTVTGPDAYGASAVVGTGTTYARDDHNHGLPAAPSVSLTTASSFITASVSVASGTNTEITSVSLGAGTWLISFQGAFGPTSSGSGFDVWIGPNSASTTGIYGAATNTGTTSADFGGAAGSAIVTLAGTTTVYLNANAGAAGLIHYAGSSALAVANVTGLTAVKIG